MDREELTDEIMALPVWDTHNHLEGSQTLCAQDFWDVGHYFWFLRELEGVGYPWLDEALELSEQDRAEAYVRAFEIGRNTTWNQAVRRTLNDLWDVEITDAQSLLHASAKIAETGQDRNWARAVCRRANVTKLTVSRESDNGLQEIDDLLCVMGSLRLPGNRELEAALAAGDQRAETEILEAEIRSQVEDLASQGRRVVRTDLPASVAVPELRSEGNSANDLREYLRHALFKALDEHSFQVQVFVGMATPPPSYASRTKGHPHHALNDPARIANLHGLFDLYAGCTFEIMNAANQSNMDIVQAARIYPSVAPGGLWWFNFRNSTYRETMQYRLEALPASRCTLLASDARCIEWLYCKTMVVKRLLAEFLCEQVERGWLDRETALYVAREWLYDAADRLYGGT